MPDILLGFGGNLGDVPAAIERALVKLPRRGVTVNATSRLYRTTPWGSLDQPDFINACSVCSTNLPPCDLLAITQELEREGGRRPGERWGPRALDIDILAYDDLALATPGLTLPHPRLTERAFVLVPLAEIAPAWMVEGRPIRDWAAQVGSTGTEPMTPVPET